MDLLFNRVYCPNCEGKNCLPIAPYLEKKDGSATLRLKVDKCLKCGIKMDGNYYMMLLKGMKKYIGARE